MLETVLTDKLLITNSPIIEKLKGEPVKDDKSGILLVPFDGSEIEKYRKWFSDPDVLKYLNPNTPVSPTDKNKKISVEEFVENVRNNPTSAYFRIQHPTYGFIGHASFSSINLEDMSFSRGIVIGEKQYWNKGIATEVGAMVLHRAKELGFKTAKASARIDNVASRANLTKQFGEGKVEGNYINFAKAL